MTNGHRFVLAEVMGWPIAHSRSPKIHNHWFAQYELEGCYAPLPVEPGRLEAALRAMPALGFAGCNLTIPHKETALRFLDHVDNSAARIGAVNCVVVERNGALIGRNYDGYGFIASLYEAAPLWRAESAPCVIIGAGGGARAIVHGLLEAGAREFVCSTAHWRARKFSPPTLARACRPCAGKNARRGSPERDFSSMRRARAWSANRR